MAGERQSPIRWGTRVGYSRSKEQVNYAYDTLGRLRTEHKKKSNLSIREVDSGAVLRFAFETRTEVGARSFMLLFPLLISWLDIANWDPDPVYPYPHLNTNNVRPEETLQGMGSGPPVQTHRYRVQRNKRISSPARVRSRRS